MSKLPKHIQVLGDPHLAKKFKTGVPPHRLGEREALVREHFAKELKPNKDTSIHVCMGDLFDKFRVPEEDILFAASTYIETALKHKKVLFVIIRGNHDASRDASVASSFDVFTALVSDIPNIKVISENPEQVDNLYFYPWHPFKNAEEIVEELLPTKDSIVFGHWDMASFGEDSSSTENMIPLEIFKDVQLAVTGHYHLPMAKKMKGVDVIVTGSMQPYTHAEDDEGVMYVTLTKAELVEQVDKAPETFKNMNVRVLLDVNDTPVADIECLSLTFKRTQGDAKTQLEVDVDAFDLQSIFQVTFEEHNVPQELTTELWNTFLDLNAQE